jgi:hypothetical protein
MSDYISLYDLDMMETGECGEFEVTRVPGGWLFKSITKHSDLMAASESLVFVPYKELNTSYDLGNSR